MSLGITEFAGGWTDFLRAAHVYPWSLNASWICRRSNRCTSAGADGPSWIAPEIAYGESKLDHNMAV